MLGCRPLRTLEPPSLRQLGGRKKKGGLRVSSHFYYGGEKVAECLDVFFASSSHCDRQYSLSTLQGIRKLLTKAYLFYCHDSCASLVIAPKQRFVELVSDALPESGF